VEGSSAQGQRGKILAAPDKGNDYSMAEKKKEEQKRKGIKVQRESIERDGKSYIECYHGG
jgi:hypothetical protein